jgi:hypothetical protein
MVIRTRPTGMQGKPPWLGTHRMLTRVPRRDEAGAPQAPASFFDPDAMAGPQTTRDPILPGTLDVVVADPGDALTANILARLL